MKKITYILLSACFLLTSCEDFLNRDPDAKVGSGDYFTDEGSLLTYINGFIQKYTPSAADLGYGDGYSDIMATEKSFTFLTNASWTPDLQSGWSISNWTPIYNINYFLVHMREAKGLSEATYNHYEGTARFWRAWQYFEKVKTFGAVPWYDEPIDPEDMVALYKPRDSREYVMERVLEDLNFACEHCYTSSDWINCARINRYIALAYKARVCLFEGTYRKYHSVDPSTGKAWEDKQASAKFLRECAEACEELMAAGVYSIVNNPAKVKTQYRELFTQEAVNTTEVIWARQMSVGMTTFHDLTWRYTSGSYGQRWSLDQDFVKTYLNLDGSRHTTTGEEFTTEIENRDYRLSQSIITPGYTKLVGGISTATPPDFTVTLTGYQVIKFNIDDKAYESASVSYNSLPIMRYAEVLLNYAEAKAELGEMDAAVWDQTIAQLRSRAGVTPVVPDKADPYMEAYFLNTVTDKWILEVRRERGIELCLEMGLRWDDDMRWHMGDLLTSDNNPWTGIWIGNTGYTYDFTGQSTDDNGDPVPDFYIRPGEDTEHSIAISNTGANQTFSLNAAGNIVWEYKRTWGEKKYLRPIPQTAITRNPNLEQNALWK